MPGDPQILWRRLDRPGHDACRIRSDMNGQGLDGVAVWLDGGGPAHLSYIVTCDEAWRTRSARIQGRAGRRDLTLSIHRDDLGIWRISGEEVPELNGLQDIDLGFTPATNTLPIRRLRAQSKDSAEIGAAWLDPSDWTLKLLPQHYRRLDTGWHYASGGFEADLTVNADGFVTDYPGMWIEEDAHGRS
ncbi:putative glycolipid-binding domain-containing protein [Paracoccus aerodenitrificans]|uniref:putative glycolipid-binding domain-containing protein n=1 Tax=Paracoccus aerodenitrificans TaxID=3017781 RepID=UPI0022F00B36|nr:putative glycolipid-binding domain-containing protein [Paracoccus aerodenitrificans]WBU65268.1 putative glycolipid-binding domain-containing protein [Paracoccus aerodenitrificans]